MTGPDEWRRGLTPRIADEVGFIRDAFQDKKIGIGLVREGAGVGYMYADGELLVLEEDLPRVTEFLRRLPGVEVSGEVYVLPGLAVVRVTGDRTVPQILEETDRALGEGRVTPNHVFTTADDQSRGEISPCEPVEPGEVLEGIEPYPSVCPGGAGAGVRVYVCDTGLLPDADQHPWLAGVAGDPDPGTPGAEGRLRPYAGHGTFVAGLVRAMAPAAAVFVSNGFGIAGSASETELIADLQRALHRGADLIHLSGTGPTRKNLPPLSFSLWLKRLRHHKGIACVAAAGNSGSSRVSWPAALPHVVSVGALAADWRSRASFTNHGGWVDVYAPGRNLINAYTSGQYVPQMTPYAGQPPRHFHGMARRSGTSFAGAIVTGLIAARMWRTGENSAEAAAALLGEARSAAIPGVGAIALPCCDRPGPGRGRGCGCGCGCTTQPQHQHHPCP